MFFDNAVSKLSSRQVHQAVVVAFFYSTNVDLRKYNNRPHVMVVRPGSGSLWIVLCERGRTVARRIGRTREMHTRQKVLIDKIGVESAWSSP